MANSIINSLRSAELSVTEMVDPNEIQFFTTSLANQVNDFRMKYAPQKMCRDLSEWITDIIIETTAQGASLLEVHIIDPAWTLLIRDTNGVSYIDVDDSGFLWPPIEVTFPKDRSDATWRLCQLRPSTSLTEANMILVFEDKIVSELREHFGQQTSYPDQTRAEFLQSLVQQANSQPAFPGEVDIRFVPLLPKETFTKADLTLQQRLPTSATQKNPPPARKEPNKPPVDPSLFRNLETAAEQSAAAVSGVEISITSGINSLTSQGFLNGYVPVAQRPSQITALPGNIFGG